MIWRASAPSADANLRAQSWNRNRDFVGGLSSIENDDTGEPIWSATRRLAGHRLDQIDADLTTYPIAHDDSGNVVSALDDDYVYDGFGRLAGVTDPGTGDMVEAYLYDASGRLAGVADPVDVHETFVYDGEEMAGAYDYATDTPLWDAVWGPGQDRLISFDDRKNGERYVPLTDNRNAIVGTWNSTYGVMDQLARYNAEGRLTLLDADTEAIACQEQDNAGVVCNNPSSIPFGFNSQWRSPTSGLLYMRNRWYSPRLAQFVSRDPLGAIDSFNPFAFASFDPINGWDPYGLFKWDRIVENPNASLPYGGEGGSPFDAKSTTPTVGKVTVFVVVVEIQQKLSEVLPLPYFNHSYLSFRTADGHVYTEELVNNGYRPGTPAIVNERGAEPSPAVGTNGFDELWKSGDIEAIAQGTIPKKQFDALRKKAKALSLKQGEFKYAPESPDGEKSVNCHSFTAGCLTRLGGQWPLGASFDSDNENPGKRKPWKALSKSNESAKERANDDEPNVSPTAGDVQWPEPWWYRDSSRADSTSGPAPGASGGSLTQ